MWLTQTAIRDVTRVQRYRFVAWDRLKAAISWKQGQHWLNVGGTGSGKSTLAGEMLPRRSRVVVAVSKGYDEIFDSSYYSEYERITKWTKGGPKEPRVLLWPANGKTVAETREIKKNVFSFLFDDVLLHTGHYCIDIDEEHYMCESLKQEQAVTDMLEQGRSFGISMMNNTQRPAGIPLATYVNSLHGAFFLTQEEYDVKRLASMANKHTHAKELKENISRLDQHEFVYIDKTGRIPPVRSMVIPKYHVATVKRDERHAA